MSMVGNGERAGDDPRPGEGASRASARVPARAPASADATGPTADRGPSAPAGSDDDRGDDA